MKTAKDRFVFIPLNKEFEYMGIMPFGNGVDPEDDDYIKGINVSIGTVVE